MIVRISLLSLCLVGVHTAAKVLQNVPPGLYSENDKLQILTKDNFNALVYRKPYSWLVEFYNSWCGHCKKFAPTWVEFSASVHNWQDVVRIGAIDCADDRNNDVCRDMEILAYPSLKFFHEQYEEGAGNIGQLVKKGETSHELTELLLSQMRSEQTLGRGKTWPDISVQNFTNAAEIWNDIPARIEVVFLIFESVNSTTGSEIILDLSNIDNIKIFRLSNSSNLTKILNVKLYPTLFAVDRYSYTPHSISMETTRVTLKDAMIRYLYDRKVSIPNYYKTFIEGSSTSKTIVSVNISNDNYMNNLIGNTVFQVDLETGLRYTLGHEIVKLKLITGESLVALKKYLTVIKKYFPFKANGKAFIKELLKNVESSGDQISGKYLSNHISQLEKQFSPVYSSTPNWVGCRGSSSNFRGFTCSLWVIFHTLTVNAADKRSTDALEVLNAMHGYVKYFFGCADCSEHFQAMALEKKLNSVAENDGAILWLWVAHNEVNYRLAGDPTEDPQFPKKQFPVSKDCLKCRDSHGSWDFEQVLTYLKLMYSEENINLMGTMVHDRLSASHITTSYMAIVIVLYSYCVIAMILILRFFFNKKVYKRKAYAHDTYGKV